MNMGQFVVKSLIKINIIYYGNDLIIPDPSGNITIKFRSNTQQNTNANHTAEIQSINTATNWNEAYNFHQAKAQKILNIISAYYLQPSWLHDERGDAIVFELKSKRKIFVYWYNTRFTREAIIKGADQADLATAYNAKIDSSLMNSMEYARFALRATFAREAYMGIAAALDSLLPLTHYTCPHCGKQLYKRTDWKGLRAYGLSKKEAHLAQDYRNRLAHGHVIGEEDEAKIAAHVPKLLHRVCEYAKRSSRVQK